MNRPITSTEIKSVILKLPINQSPGPNGFTSKFYQTFREELRPILLKLFQKITEEGTLLNSFYEATITLITKPDKDITKKTKLQANITDELVCKNPQQSTSKPAPTIFHHQVRFIPRIQEFFNTFKSINVIYHINTLKNKNHMIIPIDAEGAFDKIQHSSMIKTFQKVKETSVA